MSDPTTEVLRDACEGFDLAGLRRIVRWFLDANQQTPEGLDVYDPNFPDEWIEHCINMAYLEVVQHQILSFEGEYYRQQDLPISAGQSEVAIPGTVFKVDRAMLKIGNAFIPLSYSNSAFEPDYDTSSSAGLETPRYWLRDALTLVLNPPVQSGGTLRLKWYELPGRLCSDKAQMSLNVKYNWHYIVAARAAMIAMTKTKDDSSELQGFLGAAWNQLTNAIDRRSAGPKMITPWFGGALPGLHGGTNG